MSRPKKYSAISTPEPADPTVSKTLISFELKDELRPEEIAQFQRAARAAGAESMTEHLLNLTLRSDLPVAV